MSDQVWQLVESTLRQQCRVKVPLNSETQLARGLGLDSLALLTLAVAAEDYFQICLGEDPAAPPLTLGDFVRLVELRLHEKESNAKPG